MFYLAIVNKILRQCRSWLARQYVSYEEYSILMCLPFGGHSYAKPSILFNIGSVAKHVIF